MNPHRGDTPIEVGGETYTLCFDLNACASIMDKFELEEFEDLADKGIDGKFSLKDLIFVLWAGLQHHHPDLTVKEVGAMEWALEEVGPIIGDAFQKGLTRTVPPTVEKKPTVRRKKVGTGNKSK